MIDVGKNKLRNEFNCICTIADYCVQASFTNESRKTVPITIRESTCGETRRFTNSRINSDCIRVCIHVYLCT